MPHTYYLNKISNLLVLLVVACLTLYILIGQAQQAVALSQIDAFERAVYSYAREYCLNLKYGNSDSESSKSALSEADKSFSLWTSTSFQENKTGDKILHKMMKQKKYRDVIAEEVKQNCHSEGISFNFLLKQKSYNKLLK